MREQLFDSNVSIGKVLKMWKIRNFAVNSRRKLGGSSKGEIEWQIGHLVAAISDVKEQDSIAPRRLSRLDDTEVGRVLDPAARVPGSQRNVGDHRVEWLLRVQLAKSPSDQFLILSGLAK